MQHLKEEGANWDISGISWNAETLKPGIQLFMIFHGNAFLKSIEYAAWIWY